MLRIGCPLKEIKNNLSSARQILCGTNLNSSIIQKENCLNVLCQKNEFIMTVPNWTKHKMGLGFGKSHFLFWNEKLTYNIIPTMWVHNVLFL